MRTRQEQCLALFRSGIVRKRHNTHLILSESSEQDAKRMKTRYFLTRLDSREMLPLEKDYNLIGRDPSSGIVIEDISVSRKHAELVYRDSSWSVRDLNSKNGTYLNGEKLAPNKTVRFGPGSTLSFGKKAAYRLEKEEIQEDINIHKADMPGNINQIDAEKMIACTLSILDSIEYGIASYKGSEDNPHAQGLLKIRQQALDALMKLGIQQIDAKGKHFNPYFHNAVSHIEDKNLPPECVAEVLQAGYLFHGKVVRFAAVIVAN